MPERIPGSNVLSWAPDVDHKTADQARRAASMPFVDGHLALMPDAHFGMGATIGSVIPTQGAIIPSAVGVDIGCGMVAGRVDVTAPQLPDDLSWLHTGIARAVPAGVGQGHEDQRLVNPPPWPDTLGADYWTPKLREKALKQYGSLGSGNHFVEVCLDENEDVWILLHSGSRGVGNELAKVHIDGAKALMKRYFVQLPDPDLAYLTEGTPEFDAYITDMLWAQDYAWGNRETMLSAVLLEVERFLRRPVQLLERVNCHHNYTEREHHHGRNVWITRKGAVRAREGDRGLIPGSMATGSYIVKGLGNPASYHSCSHGAGRRMSRGQARRELDYAGLKAAMKGKAWNNDAKSLIDEDPRAYKDIDEVMENQRDLVQIEHTLHQVLNYKGT